MSVLFLCTSNLQRSPTAQQLFSKLNPAINFTSAGLDFRNCKRFKTTFCTQKMLAETDEIYVFESVHIGLVMKYGSYTDKLTNLDIEDIYQFNDEKLIDRLLNHDKLQHLK